MLNILFGDTNKAIFNTDVYFNNTFKNEWVTTPLAKDIIKDIDNSEVQSSYSIISNAFKSTIPVTMLSNGVKTLLLMLNDNSNIYNASTCGDNCAKWIMRIAEEKDLTINLLHLMNFENIHAIILNNNKEVHNYDEYVDEAVKFI